MHISSSHLYLFNVKYILLYLLIPIIYLISHIKEDADIAVRIWHLKLIAMVTTFQRPSNK